MSPDALRAALGEVVARGDFQVPPYPAVALRLQRIVARPNYSLAEVSETIAADPALAARILSVVNSSLYRASDDITSLPRAVNRLGARVVSGLAVAAGIGSGATRAGALFDVKYRAWRRSVTCALTCQKLARPRNLDESAAFLAGLIHGFGRSVAVAALEQLLTTQRGVAPLQILQWLAVAEEQREALALAVSERWQLPAEIMDALRPGVATPMAALVAEGERIAEALESSWRPEASSPAEARALDELIQGLPAALDALAAVPPATTNHAAPTVVASPDKALAGERRRCAVPLADCRKKGAAQLTGVSLALTGVEATSSAPLQEGSIVRLAAGVDAERIETWFNVLLSTPNGAAWRVEAELFSPPREIKEAWQSLFARAAPL